MNKQDRNHAEDLKFIEVAKELLFLDDGETYSSNDGFVAFFTEVGEETHTLSDSPNIRRHSKDHQPVLVNTSALTQMYMFFKANPEKIADLRDFIAKNDPNAKDLPDSAILGEEWNQNEKSDDIDYEECPDSEDYSDDNE